MNPAGNVATAIVHALLRHGVRVIFAQSLPSALILAAEAAGIRQLAYRQENMGGAMADGFARISGRVGVVAAQNGPAATLLVPPLAEALKASVPVVALVQEVETTQVDRNAFQELDHLALFAGCAKWVRRLPAADRVDDYVDAAFAAAGSGRPGPAVLLLPADLLRSPAVASFLPRRLDLGTWPLDRVRPADSAIAEAADAIVAARAPVVMAGGGVLLSRAADALARLQEVASLPVFTTIMGKGAVAETHKLSAGAMGPLTGPRALGAFTRPLLARADLVLLVGTRTNQNGTDSWRLIPPGARVLHIDIDPAEIGRTYEAMRLVGDAGATLEALADALERRDLAARHAARSALEAEIAAAWSSFAAANAAVMGQNSGLLRPERVVAEIQAAVPDDAILVADASYSSMWLAGYLRRSLPGARLLTPRGLAGLGWGLPLAIGAKIARPEAEVVALVGDGGFGHSWAELETLARSQVKLTIVVLNNGVLGYQKDAEAVKFGRATSACVFAPVDHAAIARACGCGGLRVSEPGGFAPALRTALMAETATLIDVETDPAAHPPLSLFAGTLDR